MRMPAMRVLVNTPAPQGSTGITTNVFPSMTLGCGAMAGNITSDNVGPQHLINIKRLAYVVRKPEEAFEMPLDYNAAPYGPSRSRPAVGPSIAAPWSPRWSAIWLRAASRVGASAPRRGADRACSCASAPAHAVAAGRGGERRRRSGGPLPGAPRQRRRPQAATADWPRSARQTPGADASDRPRSAAKPVDFVCEADVRDAIRENRKIYIGPKTIVTPSARDLAGPSDILVLA